MRRLIVIVPGIYGEFKHWNELTDRLKQEPALKDTCFTPWDHKKRVFSLGSPVDAARSLSAFLDQEWSARGPFDDIVLVGHSLGGVVVRQAYLFGSGGDHKLPRIAPWASHVSRIILFASVNRGVDASETSFFNGFWLKPTAWLCRMIAPLRLFLLTKLLRGSDYITDLRLCWIRHFATMGDKAPVVVQLLGTEDKLVSATDSVDVEQFRNSFYIPIPGANHADLYWLNTAADPDGRYALLRDSFIHHQPNQAINRDFKGASRVVFVVHGIRADNLGWVDETAAYITATWPEVQVIPLHYEYTTAFKFAYPPTRRRNLRHFQDQYSEALARNPQATFSFIGHSNGTYLFGESLRKIRGIQFDRAVLVGSVLPQNFDWNALMPKQLQSIRVDASCYDWPVAWLCNALRGLGMKDIGTGGYFGFTNACAPGNKIEYRFYEGGHGAPLASSNLPALARFALTGEQERPTLTPERKWFSVVSLSLNKLSLLALFALFILGVAHFGFAFILIAVLVVTVSIVILDVI